MTFMQYDKTKKELIVEVLENEKRYDHLGRELHDEIFNNLDCIFKNVGLLPKSCDALKGTDCSFPIGWKIRKMHTNDFFTCEVWNKDLYRTE